MPAGSASAKCTWHIPEQQPQGAMPAAGGRPGDPRGGGYGKARQGPHQAAWRDGRALYHKLQLRRRRWAPRRLRQQQPAHAKQHAGPASPAHTQQHAGSGRGLGQQGDAAGASALAALQPVGVCGLGAVPPQHNRSGQRWWPGTAVCRPEAGRQWQPWGPCAGYDGWQAGLPGAALIPFPKVA